jgi:hypothetical protein
MYPEDRVLVAYVPEPEDFARARAEGWYRIPLQYAPKGLYAEYIAFYFGQKFGDQKWSVHYYARNLGHELTTRRALLPDQPSHPRADHIYYKVQLGPLEQRRAPIVSLRWRRVTFIHTTWDRFQDASEINDLFLDGGPYVDRLYATLKERGIQAERNYVVGEPASEYIVPLAVPCAAGVVQISSDCIPGNETEVEALADEIAIAAIERGGVQILGDLKNRPTGKLEELSENVARNGSDAP